MVQLCSSWILVTVLLAVLGAGSCSLPRVPLMLTKRFKLFNFHDASKIVGGIEAKKDEFPYQASLQREGIPGDFSHFCGGSIIGSNCIVTASHCVDGRSPDELYVVVGSNALDQTPPLRVAEVLSNPTYNPDRVLNDIAILKLEKNLTYSASVKPIALPSRAKTEVQAGTIAVVSGWGTTSENGNLAPTLRYVEVPIISDAECRKDYGVDEIASSMLCAGLEKGGKDSCQGDSGGPLVANKELIGIVSWGLGCARPEYPGVYTQVSYYLDFIKSQGCYP